LTEYRVPTTGYTVELEGDFQGDNYLTQQEKVVIAMAGSIMSRVSDIVGDDRSRSGDLREILGAVHLIQNTILAQAAGRLYPDQYRLLGETLQDPPVVGEVVA
jgi:hypothetical protein